MSAATDPGRTDRANEDHFIAGTDFVVLADGATSRTESGCEFTPSLHTC